ncbi:hypothetical protein BDZ97DRAFT_1764003 [Flammula alnicola]|nr:hypothetical protein BDZ97DRAFT_1764003 [Flammula alnicola]
MFAHKDDPGDSWYNPEDVIESSVMSEHELQLPDVDEHEPLQLDEQTAAYDADNFHQPFSSPSAYPGSLQATPTSPLSPLSRQVFHPFTQSWMPPEVDPLDALQLPDEFVDSWLNEHGFHRFNFMFSPSQMGPHEETIRGLLHQLEEDYAEFIKQKNATTLSETESETESESESELPVANLLPPPPPMPPSPSAAPTVPRRTATSPSPPSASTMFFLPAHSRTYVAPRKAGRIAAKLAKQLAALDAVRYDIYRRYKRFLRISRE